MNKKILLVLISTILLTTLCANRATAKAKEILLKTGGVFTGITVSPFIGGIRGLSKGFMIGTDVASEMFGDKEGSVHRMVGFGTGGIIGGAGGWYAGFLMGAYEGVKYGVESTFSKENFSLGGNSFSDYELL